MKLRFVRERALAELKASIEENLEKYRKGDFAYLSLDPSLSFEAPIEVSETQLAKLKAPDDDKLFDSENCIVLLAALKKLTPFQAADERLWVMLTHTLMLEYGRKRWPIPQNDKMAIKHIQTHFFGSTQRQLERDNIASRLWWMGHLCARVDGLEVKEGLDVLLHRTDVRANIIERPTTAQSIPIFSAVLQKLAQSMEGKGKLFERNVFRRLMVRLNGLGGYKLLDALDTRTVEKFIGDIISKDLKLSENEI
ncbi:MAG TPA: DUF6339 family protein [Stellaceae bacterium]